MTADLFFLSNRTAWASCKANFYRTAWRSAVIARIAPAVFCVAGVNGPAAQAQTLPIPAETAPDNAATSQGVPRVAARDQVNGSGRSVVNTRYRYAVSPQFVPPGDFQWNWGDGLAADNGSPIFKVWNRPGTFNVSVNLLIGDGSVVPRTRTVTVIGKPIAAGDTHTCAIRRAFSGTAHSVMCWGSNEKGYLGDGRLANSTRPVRVRGLTNVVGLEAGGGHTCALTRSGQVQCWGSNESGQLGDGTRVNRREPSPVRGLSGVVALAAGGAYTCALTDAGLVKCWGQNITGALGNGTRLTRLRPTDVPELSGVVALTASNGTSCALKQDSTMLCWGQNTSGQLGDTTADGTIDDKQLPSLVTNSSGVVAISAGSFHVCALKNSGRVSCWGSDRSGQLGDGNAVAFDFALPNTNSRRNPVEIPELSGVSAIAANSEHSCALLANSTVQCWGRNDSGQVGDNTVLTRLAPVTVSGLQGVASVASGSSHTCALKRDGRVSCWGRNQTGQLGDGTLTNKSVPGPVAAGDIFWR